MELDVLCVGSATEDVICLVDDLPGPDQRTEALSFVTAGGGPAATAAVTLARLGVRAGFCGVIAEGAEGDRLTSSLEEEGVDVRWVVRDAVPFARAVVIASKSAGERAIVTSPPLTLPSDRVPVGAAPVVHVDQAGYRPVREALAGSAHESRVSIDGGNLIDGLRLDDIWLYAPSVAKLIELFPAGDAHESARAAIAAGAQNVVATDGARGSIWVDALGQTAVQPSFEVPIVSTLGAGDVFHGALLAAILDGQTSEEALRWANGAAALSCAALDGRSAIPDRATLERFLAQHPRPHATHGGIQ